MKRDVIIPQSEFKSSLLSCEKDAELILNKIFVKAKPWNDKLKRLLVINTKDCLDNYESQTYKDAVNRLNLRDLKEKGYIRFEPKILMNEHEEVKSYIILTFDHFAPTSNNEFRDCIINFDILCHTDYWDLGDFRVRPLKIAGYIDGILNKTRLTGIGRLEFAGMKMLVLDEVLAGYTLVYRAVHGSDDLISKR